MWVFLTAQLWSSKAKLILFAEWMSSVYSPAIWVLAPRCESEPATKDCVHRNTIKGYKGVWRQLWGPKGAATMRTWWMTLQSKTRLSKTISIPGRYLNTGKKDPAGLVKLFWKCRVGCLTEQALCPGKQRRKALGDWAGKNEAGNKSQADCNGVRTGKSRFPANSEVRDQDGRMNHSEDQCAEGINLRVLKSSLSYQDPAESKAE